MPAAALAAAFAALLPLAGIAKTDLKATKETTRI
jgi:hypothetical protein